MSTPGMLTSSSILAVVLRSNWVGLFLEFTMRYRRIDSR
jgi:hypothetical protein